MKCTGSGLRKGAWTTKEDMLLKNYIQKHGEGKWHLVPLKAGLNRCRKSCRLRWMNYLRPDIKRGDFEEDEVDLVVRLHKLLGNRWSLIAGRIPGRTANDVKNYWNTHLRSRDKQQNQDTMVTVIKPQPQTFSKAQNSFNKPHDHDGNPITSSNYMSLGSNNNIMDWEELFEMEPHVDGNLTRSRSSNHGSTPSPIRLNEKINEFWEELFDGRNLVRSSPVGLDDNVNQVQEEQFEEFGNY